MRTFVIAVAILAIGAGLPAQAQETFTARLSPVAIEPAQRNNVTGQGSASATLSGNRLSITGSFAKLQTPATIARLHHGKGTGIRGPALADVTVVHAMEGTITASLTLTTEQIEALRRGRLYIQIHSEKAPEGNLWGWLFRQERTK